MPPHEVDEATREWTIEVRRRLHRRPGATGEEVGTQAILLELLSELGIPARKAGGYGVLARVEGALPGATVALRADMDALSITEAPTDLNTDYISEVPGAMHACGHDGHMAMVLGAARVLASARDRLRGTVVLVLQPHEEEHPGGSMAMIEDGALEGVDAILGFHIMGYLDAPLIAFRPGPIMAHIRSFELRVTGSSGHHMDPDACIDPIVVAARFIGSIEHDVARAIDPTKPFVLGFGKVHGGTQFNQTPDEVTVVGTFRTFDEGVADRIEAVMRRNLDGLMTAFRKDPGDGLPAYDLDIIEGYPVLENDPGLTRRATTVLRAVHDHVDPDTRLNFGAEDFAHYARRVPALFRFLGTRNAVKGITAVNHSSRFDIDEDVLEVGVRALLALVDDITGQGP